MDTVSLRLTAAWKQLESLGYVRIYGAAHRLDLGLLRLEVWTGPQGLLMIRSLEVESALALRIFELCPSSIELFPEVEGCDDRPA